VKLGLIEATLMSSQPTPGKYKDFNQDNYYNIAECANCGHDWGQHSQMDLGPCRGTASISDNSNCNCPYWHYEATDTTSKVLPLSMTADGIMGLFKFIELNPSEGGPRKGRKGTIVWSTKPNDDEVAWLNANALAIAHGHVTVESFWQNWLWKFWFARDKEWIQKWDDFGYKPYIEEYYLGFQRHFQASAIGGEMKSYVTQGTASRPRTQKAKGLLGIDKLRAALYGMKHNLRSHEFYLVKPENVIECDNLRQFATELMFAVRAMAGHGSQVFARPCPHRPRHGFADSRVIEFPNLS
jgi:hypothetical protein